MVNGKMTIEMAGAFWTTDKQAINIRDVGKWIGKMDLEEKSH